MEEALKSYFTRCAGDGDSGIDDRRKAITYVMGKQNAKIHVLKLKQRFNNNGEEMIGSMPM